MTIGKLNAFVWYIIGCILIPYLIISSFISASCDVVIDGTPHKITWPKAADR